MQVMRVLESRQGGSCLTSTPYVSICECSNISNIFFDIWACLILWQGTGFCYNKSTHQLWITCLFDSVITLSLKQWDGTELIFFQIKQKETKNWYGAYFFPIHNICLNKGRKKVYLQQLRMGDSSFFQLQFQQFKQFQSQRFVQFQQFQWFRFQRLLWFLRFQQFCFHRNLQVLMIPAVFVVLCGSRTTKIAETT